MAPAILALLVVLVCIFAQATLPKLWAVYWKADKATHKRYRLLVCGSPITSLVLTLAPIALKVSYQVGWRRCVGVVLNLAFWLPPALHDAGVWFGWERFRLLSVRKKQLVTRYGRFYYVMKGARAYGGLRGSFIDLIAVVDVPNGITFLICSLDALVTSYSLWNELTEPLGREGETADDSQV